MEDKVSAELTISRGTLQGWGGSGCRELVNNNILVYGEAHDFIVNMDKTKEIVMDFRKNLRLHDTNDLSWAKNTVATVK